MKTYDLEYRGKEVFKKGKFDGYKLTFAFGNGSTMQKNVFKNDKKFGAIVSQLEPGDKVSVTIDDDDKFKRMTGLELLSKGGDGGNAAPAGPRNSVQRKKNAGAEFRTPAEITRTEALKLAIDTVGLLAKNPDDFTAMKKSMTFDGLELIITTTAANYESFITGKPAPDSAPADVENTPEQDGDGDPGPSDEDDIPF